MFFGRGRKRGAAVAERRPEVEEAERLVAAGEPFEAIDMLNRANMIGYRSGFYEDRELEAAFDVVTRAGASALGLADYGIVVGASADFVAMAAQHVPEAVVAVPKDRTVYRRGRAVAKDGKMG